MELTGLFLSHMQGQPNQVSIYSDRLISLILLDSQCLASN